jgi:hypothetical protein
VWRFCRVRRRAAAKANPDKWLRYEAISLLGGALLGQRRYTAAESLIVAGYNGTKAREPRIAVPDRSRLLDAAERNWKFAYDRALAVQNRYNSPHAIRGSRQKAGEPKRRLLCEEKSIHD